VALNKVEFEYVAACPTSREVVWLHKLQTIGLNLTCRQDLQKEDDETCSGGQVMKSTS
jgi:hypothetical protein